MASLGAHARGYDHAHRALRAHYQQLLDTRGWLTCWRCHGTITAGQPWDLGHRTDRALDPTARADAPEHRHATATCPGNRRAGARLGLAIRYGKRITRRSW